MKHIKKQTEPRSLLEHRTKINADYDNYENKNDLRLSLLEEQGYICCYCMQRIKIDDVQLISKNMKIEHWQCQDEYPNKQLDYNNLLATCLGNEGKPSKEQHCDTKKGNSDIKINLHEETISYLIIRQHYKDIFQEN